MEYFSSINDAQLPDKTYMFDVLAPLRFEVLNNMVQRAHKNRSAENPEDENELIHVTKEIYEEIMAVASYKCEIIFVII